MVCLAHAAAPGKKKKKVCILVAVQFATNVLPSVIFPHGTVVEYIRGTDLREARISKRWRKRDDLSCLKP